MANGQHLPVPTRHCAWLTLWLGPVASLPALPTAVLTWTAPKAHRLDD
ncbi:hypothetical protein SAMN00790413_03067 [Deinococcus hopiensis KR-140]|uniref:Uncharacterized protein n=1 Tax=Deinococcus hopiensis KR-140 TaxID=695939 RepID=A0A1W1VRC8_9DEIO|nr:hypothetical protein SAMN00790413_03067 [Deinococcus hopiensis KR-140]